MGADTLYGVGNFVNPESSDRYPRSDSIVRKRLVTGLQTMAGRYGWMTVGLLLLMRLSAWFRQRNTLPAMMMFVFSAIFLQADYCPAGTLVHFVHRLE